MFRELFSWIGAFLSTGAEATFANVFEVPTERTSKGKNINYSGSDREVKPNNINSEFQNRVNLNNISRANQINNQMPPRTNTSYGFQKEH